MGRTIIVPLDGSATAKAAVPVAVRLAQDNDLVIDVIHVLSPVDQLELVALSAGLPGISAETVSEVRRRAAEQDLQRMVERLGATCTATWTVRTGDPATTIAEYARETKAVAIVMATHGRSGVTRWALGSVAERMLSLAPVPLLLVRAGASAASPPAPSIFARVLVPLDGSPLAQAVLAPLLELASEVTAHIDLLRVVDPVVVDGIARPDAPTAIAEAELRPVAAELERRGFETAVHVRIGRPAETILATAEELSASLIALSTHGRSGIGAWLFGSVAAKVLRSSPIPLLVVNSRAAWQIQRPILRARDVMTREVVSVRPDQSLADVVNLLLQRQVSGMPVIDQAGRLVGIISEYDIIAWEEKRARLAAAMAEGSGTIELGLHRRSAQELRERKVAEVMTEQVVTVTPDTPISAIARLMMDHLVNRVPVVEHDRVVGVVSRFDVVRALAMELEQTDPVVRPLA